MPPPPPPARGRRATPLDPDRLLEAAERVFAREGVEGASLRGIAREAGCDPALIYYHFESKEAMFSALLDRRIPPLAEDLQRLADPGDLRPLPYRLREVMGLYRRHIGHHAGLRAVIRGEMVRGTEGIRDRIAKQVHRTGGCVWALLRQGLERGELRPGLPVELTGFFFIKLYLEILDVLPAMAPRVAGMPAEAVVDRAERAWLETFWRGVAADPLAPLPGDLFRDGFDV